MKSKTMLTAFCSLLVSCAMLCSCSSQQASNSSEVSGTQQSNADTTSAETSQDLSDDNAGIITFSVNIAYPEEPDDNPGSYPQYIEYNDSKYVRTGLANCEFSEGEGDSYDVDNERLCFVTSLIGQEQITEYSQWYEFIALQEYVGKNKDDPTDKLYKINDVFLVTEIPLENGYMCYTLWKRWETE